MPGFIPQTPENEKQTFSIFKTDDDKRLVFGWASISITVDGEQLEDRQKDIIDPEDLEEAAYEYVLNFRDTGEEHISTMRKKGKLVESCVFTEEKQKAIGIPLGTVPIGWWVGFKIEDDAAWQKVKNGTYKMFSIEGKASREPVEKADRPKGCGVLVIRDGKILAGTRIEPAGDGKICGPGGHIEEGETPKEAAIREAEEEFGIICRDIKPVGILEGKDGKAGSAIFICTQFDNEPETDEKEMTSPRWLTKEELQKRSNLYPPFAASLALLPETNTRKAVAKTFEDVLKFNPYHDSKGRFTSKPGGAASTAGAGAAANAAGTKAKVNPDETRRVWAKAGGGGGSYTAGGSTFKPGGTYGDQEFSVPASEKGQLTVNIAPRASGFQDGKYVDGNRSTAILDKGNVVVSDGTDVRDKVAFAVKTEVRRLGGATEPGVFFRGTNNKDEISLLESGKLRNSENHATGEKEDGVSVWDGMNYASHKYTYKVTGEIVGQGADGEPVLDPKTMKVVGGIKSTADYMKEFNAAEKKGERIFMDTYGWDESQLKQATSGGYKKEQLTSRAVKKSAYEAAQTFTEVLKFNPYHDSRGRFSSANSYASFTTRTRDPKKQHWADMAAARLKQQAAAAQPATPPKPKKNYDRLGFADHDDADYHQLYAGRKYYQQQNLTSTQKAATTKYLEANPERGSLYSHSQNLNYKMATGQQLTGAYKKTHDDMMTAMHNLGYNVNLTRYDHAGMVNGLLQTVGAGTDYEKMSASQIKKALVGQTISENKFLSTSYNNFSNAPASTKQIFDSRAVKINYKAKASVQAMMPGVGAGGDFGEIVVAPRTSGRITDVRLTGQMVRRKGTQTYNQPRIEIDIELG